MTDIAMAPGESLGRFRIERKLGAGGMGEVYKAKDTKLGRAVAIKVLPARYADEPARREMFEREARAASALTHPNIVTVYDAGVEGAHRFLKRVWAFAAGHAATLQRATASNLSQYVRQEHVGIRLLGHDHHDGDRRVKVSTRDLSA